MNRHVPSQLSLVPQGRPTVALAVDQDLMRPVAFGPVSPLCPLQSSSVRELGFENAIARLSTNASFAFGGFRLCLRSDERGNMSGTATSASVFLREYKSVAFDKVSGTFGVVSVSVSESENVNLGSYTISVAGVCFRFAYLDRRRAENETSHTCRRCRGVDGGGGGGGGDADAFFVSVRDQVHRLCQRLSVTVSV